jgi:MtN3 and saliva related transmembrane protein
VNFVENIGFVAATCTTLSFIPQLTKIRKQGGRDLSYGMLSVYLLGLMLWLVYGLYLHALAVIVANAASIVLVATAIVMKAVIPVPSQTDGSSMNSSQISASDTAKSHSVTVQS